MLQSHLKSMLWTAVGASLFITAIMYAIKGIGIAESAADASVSAYPNQITNISSRQNFENQPHKVAVDRYTGAQVIYMWRNSSKEGWLVTVNGISIPAPGRYPDPELQTLLSQIDGKALYSAIYQMNGLNEIEQISFTGQ